MLDGGEIVADEQDGAAAARDLLHLAETLVLECEVADGEDFVDDQDFRFEMRCDGESQPDIHAAGIVLHLRVEEALDLGKGHDLVELPRDLPRDMPRMAPLR